MNDGTQLALDELAEESFYIDEGRVDWEFEEGGEGGQGWGQQDQGVATPEEREPPEEGENLGGEEAPRGRDREDPHQEGRRECDDPGCPWCHARRQREALARMERRWENWQRQRGPDEASSSSTIYPGDGLPGDGW